MKKDDTKKGLSTTALAKKLNKSSQELFQQLFDLGLIVKKGSNWELTASGSAKGGSYKETKKFGRYIYWPISLKAELDEKYSENPAYFLTSTEIGKYFEISPTSTNSILSELGLIEKENQGWVVTEFGKRLGGVQLHIRASGAPYVRWPESIKTQKILVDSIRDITGDASIPDQGVAKETQGNVNFRDKFKPGLRATDGHYVRSRAELLIDNWLYMSELVHAYERKLPVEEEVYSDFYIPKGKVYIEYWGFSEDLKYLSRKEKKLEIYRKYGFRLIQLFDEDVKNIDDTLPRLLIGFGVTI